MKELKTNKTAVNTQSIDDVYFLMHKMNAENKWHESIFSDIWIDKLPDIAISLDELKWTSIDNFKKYMPEYNIITIDEFRSYFDKENDDRIKVELNIVDYAFESKWSYYLVSGFIDNLPNEEFNYLYGTNRDVKTEFIMQKYRPEEFKDVDRMTHG